jgi:hypothetical protein
MSKIRLPDLAPTSSGNPRPGPDTKETGARLVASVMTRAEKPQGTSNGKAVRFELEDKNHAKHVDNKGGFGL